MFIQNPVFYSGNGAHRKSENGPGAAAVQSLNVMDGGKLTVSCFLHMRSLMVVYSSGVSAEYQVCTVVTFYVSFLKISIDLIWFGRI